MPDYSNFIKGASAKYGVPSDILTRMVQAESSGNPRAVSNKGAQGLMQLMPGTAKELGVTDPFDPEQSIYGGAAYLAQQYKRFGDWQKALVAYNAGPGNVGKADTWPGVQDYISKVVGMPNLKTFAQGIISDPQRKQILGQAIEAGQAATKARTEAKAAIAKSDERTGAVLKEMADERAAAPTGPNLRDIPGPPRAKPPSDPMKVFGEVVPMMAIFGSAFTRNGALAAMKTATTAMTAVKTRDAEEAKAARDLWTDQVRQLQAQNQLEADRYKAVIDNRRLTMSERIAELQALAAQSRNPMMLAQLEQGNVDNALKLVDTYDAVNGRLADLLADVERQDTEERRLDLDTARYADEIEVGKIQQALARGDKLTATQWNVLRQASMGSLDDRIGFLTTKREMEGLSSQEQTTLNELTELKKKSGFQWPLGGAGPGGADQTEDKETAKTPGADAKPPAAAPPPAAPPPAAPPAAAPPRGGFDRASANPQAQGPARFRIATAEEREQMRQIKAQAPDRYQQAKELLRQSGVDTSEFE